MSRVWKMLMYNGTVIAVLTTGQKQEEKFYKTHPTYFFDVEQR